MTDVSIPASGGLLRGMLFFPPQPLAANPAVLFLHGWTSNLERYVDLATALAEHGYICLIFDLPGHGASDGDIHALTRTDFLEAAIAAYDFLLHSEGVDPKQITAIGSSFGSYLAALLSVKRSCAGLCLRAPANYPDSGFDEPHQKRADAYYEGMVDEEKKQWKSTVHPYTETAALRAIHDFAGRLLVVESEADELVPSAIPQSYAKALPNQDNLTYHILKDAPHSISDDPARQEEFLDLLLAWLGAR
ncbi:MAG TPA: alpha/beta fold hydrolase [Candidatus Paceibacterota bacterium]|nr:alpha/beta fold hydrolase [Candidatus Paceibacterota bacterium]